MGEWDGSSEPALKNRKSDTVQWSGASGWAGREGLVWGPLMRHLGETDDETHCLGVSSLLLACCHFTGYEHTQIQVETPGMEVSPSWPLETLSLKSGPAKWDFKNSFNEWLHFAAKAWTRSQNTLLDLFLWSVSERSYAMAITLSTDNKRSLSYFVPLLQYVLSGWPSHIGSTFLKLRIN